MSRVRRDSENSLPIEVQRLLERIGIGDDTHATEVQLRQRGQMRQDEASRWAGFSASQVISLEACAFRWQAQTGPLGAVRVVDAFDGAHAALDVTLLGVARIARLTPSPQLNRGELQRYLAELPWAPDAIARNRALRWRVAEGGALCVEAGADGAEMRFALNDEGLIAEAFAPARPRAVGASFVETPWRGRFLEYRRHEGRLLPFAAEVAWLGAGRAETVWRGRLVGWRAAGRS